MTELQEQSMWLDAVGVAFDFDLEAAKTSTDTDYLNHLASKWAKAHDDLIDACAETDEWTLFEEGCLGVTAIKRFLELLDLRLSILLPPDKSIQ